jgi:hypothetical protein
VIAQTEADKIKNYIVIEMKVIVLSMVRKKLIDQLLKNE